MARYIDADKMREDWLENGENEYVYDTNSVLDSIDAQPTADVVEVDTIKAWLYEMAINNVGCDGDFSKACEEIISRIDGLRNFAKERSEGDG